MGITLAPDDPNFAGAMTDKVNGLVQDMMDKNPGMTQAQAKEQVYANAAVLHAAKNAADSTKMSQEDIIDLLSNDGAQGNIVANLNQDPSKALSQAALAYGMYTAYAHSTGRQELIDNTDTPTAVLGQLDDDGFQAYINSDKGKTDLEGYLAALEMINSSSNDTDAVSELLVNGFNDPELVNIINNAVGE